MKRLKLDSARWPARSQTVRFGLFGLIVMVGLGARASGQSFGLDDNPAAPIGGGPVGPIPGFGAEDPFGFVGPPLAPSPSLGFLGPLADGAWLSPGPVIQHPGPNGFYIDAFSSHHTDLGTSLRLEFSVDRVTLGLPGTAVASEAGFGQAHGDIYAGTHAYISPGVFAGTLGPGPFVGPLPSIAGGAPGNFLLTDESAFGLLTSGGIVPPGVAVPPPIVTPGLHDNVDSWDNIVFDANGDGLFDVDTYFTLYPDEALLAGLSPADIIVVAAGDGGAIPVAYAPAPAMGLDGGDSIDALAMYDNNAKPIPLAIPGAPGTVEPVLDYALFSLAPGSPSLAFFGLDAADIFFTDFTGAFALYATSGSLGLLTTPPGLPFGGESVDALDVVAEPGILIRDGECEYFLQNTTGARLSAAAGLASLTTGATDHLFQNWFWYRGPGDSREYALSNRIYASASANHLRMVFLEPIGDGAIPNALLFDLEYTISDLSAAPLKIIGNPKRRCEVVIAIKVRNLTGGPLGVDLFSYNDMDLNASAGSDSAVISGVSNHVQFISDSSALLAGGIYKVSSTDLVAWEIDAFAIIRNKLTDAVVDVLANGVSPFGPGDYAGAQQWNFGLGPAGSVLAPVFDEWVGSVVLEVDVKRLPVRRLRQRL